jgi:hypothetical protein
MNTHVHKRQPAAANSCGWSTPFGVTGGDRCAKEELHMGILDELLGGGQRQKEYKDFR